MIKANIEAQVSDDVMKKLVEVLEKAEKPIKEIQVEISNVSGRATVKVIPAEEQASS